MVALFVESSDPLLFYRSIAEKSAGALNRGGQLLVEIHRDFARECIQLFANNGFVDCELRKDLSGNDRMIKATLK